MHYLDSYGWPHPKPQWLDHFSSTGQLQSVSMTLGFIPVLLGVFLGAPLLAGDLENGTAKLVTTQAVSRVRWLATKLGVTALVIVVGTSALSAGFGWWWGPVKTESSILDWTSGAAFDNTGPVPVALTLFTVIGGIAIGMLLRRVLLSMVVTFGFAVAVQLIWSFFRLSLGHVVTITTHTGGMAEPPALPAAAHEMDQSFVTASGKLYGYGTCMHGSTPKAIQACLDGKGIVGWSVKYLPMSQMSSMQWLGTSILLALTAAITVFIFLWGRKRLV
jgi:ABC-type transport system involved in multi-copper enzyme maturation permease subunit